MNSFRLKPEDFDLGLEAASEGQLLIQTQTECKWAHKKMAEQANARLKEMLKVAPVVSGRCFSPTHDAWHWFNDPEGSGPPEKHTHTARLVDIREIEK